MASVILFRPVYDPEGRFAPTFPWALIYLASTLKDRGIDVTIIDEPVDGDYRETLPALLKSKRPVAVGISSMTGEQIRYGLEFAQCVREHSDAAIVWGGIHVNLKPKQTALHPLVDYVVSGEGEYSFAELVERLSRGERADGIPGVFWAEGQEVQGTPPGEFIDLRDVPQLPLDAVDVERYIMRRSDLGAKRYFELCTSRGCPHRCGFCYIECVHSRRWRPIPADEVLKRLRALTQQYNLDGLLFREDNFFVNRSRIEAIARGLLDEGPKITWVASCRIDYVDKYDDAFLELLRESGCAMLIFGVESGNNRVLEFIHKDITREAVLRVARRLENLGIRGSYHFMGGFPGETPGEFLDTMRLVDTLLRETPSADVRHLALFAPYPGTNLTGECVTRGYVEPDHLEAWTQTNWNNPLRPWLTPEQSRLLADAQFLMGRLDHPNPLIRKWIWWRWNQLVASEQGIILRERPLFEAARRIIKG